MFGVSSPDDFLAQCYQIADLFAVIGRLVGEILTLVGITVPDLRGVCFDIFQLINS